MSGTSGGAGHFGTGAGSSTTGNNSGSARSSSGGAPGTSASSQSSTGGWKSAKPTVQYMPAVLGCACHQLREASVPPPDNAGEVAPKAAWTDGVVAPRAALGPNAEGSTTPSLGAHRASPPTPGTSVWTKGNLDGSKPQTDKFTIGDRPTAPKTPTTNSELDAYLAGLKVMATKARITQEAKQSTPGYYKTDIDKETLEMLKALEARLSTPEGTASLKAEMESAKNDPMYQYMGPDKFAASLAWSDALLDKLRSSDSPAMQEKARIADAANLTTLERVALFGYTTGDYNAINPAMRGTISDPGLQAYVDHINDALAKLPDYQGDVRRATGNGSYTDAWQPGADWTSGAFLSTTKIEPGSVPATGDWVMTIEGENRGKDVSMFSAWPAESEVLIPGGSTMEVVSVDRTKKPMVVVMRPKPGA